jgi:hypothetical protein
MRRLSRDEESSLSLGIDGTLFLPMRMRAILSILQSANTLLSLGELLAFEFYFTLQLNGDLASSSS